MSRITKLRIKNILGIKEYESNGKDLELRGVNGTGKTSIIDAIRFALNNKTDREYVIRDGESEGEVLLETSNGVSISRKPRTNKTDYKSVRNNGDEVQSPEAFLRELFTELQLNPVEFMDMNPKEQNRIVLDLIDFKWDLNWIKEQFGEIFEGIDYEQNIISVLNQICSEDGILYKRRQDINRDIRNKEAYIQEIASTLPPNYNPEQWEKVSIGEIHKKIERIHAHNKAIEDSRKIVESQDGKIRSFQADLQIELSGIEKDTSVDRTNLTKEIERLKGELAAKEKELLGLEEKKQHKIDLANQTYKANVAEFEAKVLDHKERAGQEIQDTAALIEEAERAENMKSLVNESRRMQGFIQEIESLQQEALELTNKIEHARNLPAEILKQSQLPFENLTVVDGNPYINGRPISNLSEGEKLSLCVSVATHKKNSLHLILIDGVERLSTENREKLYATCKEKGVQFIATRTTDDPDLQVIEV